MGFTYTAKEPTYEFNRRGLVVDVKQTNRPDKDIDKALRKLKKKCQAEGIPQEVRARQHYEKPSIKRKRKRAMAIKRWKKQVREKYQDFYMQGFSKADIEQMRQNMEREAKRKLKKEEQEEKRRLNINKTQNAFNQQKA